MTWWSRLFVCAMCMLCVTHANPVDAAISKLPTHEGVGDVGGGPHHLPIGGGVTREEAIAHAYTMPAVATAIQEMLARGYVPYRDHDEAGVSQNPPLTMVALQFEKPGLVPPTDHMGAPVLMIGSTLDENGMAMTWVSGGMTFVNMNTGHMFTADSLPEYQHTDGSFDVVEYSGGDPGSPLKQPLLESTILGASNSPGDKKFRKWVYCFAAGSLGRIFTIVATTPPAPQLTIGRIVVEHVILAATCAIGVLSGG